MATNKANNNDRKSNAGTKRKKKSNKSKRMKRMFIIDAVIFFIILAIYLGFGFYYNSHFFGNSVINGVNASNMTTAKAEEAINAQVKLYNLTLALRNGSSDIIYGKNIDLHTVFEGGLSELLKQQNGLLWPISLFKPQELEIGTMIQYDESLLKAYFQRLNCFDEANMVEPVNAAISEYGENGYEIVPENPGAKVIEDKLYDAVVHAINSLEPSLSIEELGGYEVPNITFENPQLIKAIEEMNKIAGAKITYEFGKDTEVLDGKKISEWITVDDNYQVHLNTDGIKEYVDYIGKTYNSFGRVRSFKTSYGDVLDVKGGDYGWWLDRVTEVAELTELVQKGEQLIKAPVYFQTAQQYGKDDIGNTYVEINLTAQHLFFYKDGELVVESDFVSGNVSKDYSTPVGTYPIQYKENDATLVGEDYETPVKYWMPFNKNIGLHDAKWRNEFGKDIYLTRGSHGCINMPPAAAKKVFEKIKRGVAVVVYELPGTESYDKKVEKNTTKKPAQKPVVKPTDQ